MKYKLHVKLSEEICRDSPLAMIEELSSWIDDEPEKNVVGASIWIDWSPATWDEDFHLSRFATLLNLDIVQAMDLEAGLPAYLTRQSIKTAAAG